MKGIDFECDKVVESEDFMKCYDLELIILKEDLDMYWNGWVVGIDEYCKLVWGEKVFFFCF